MFRRPIAWTSALRYARRGLHDGAGDAEHVHGDARHPQHNVRGVGIEFDPVLLPQPLEEHVRKVEFGIRLAGYQLRAVGALRGDTPTEDISLIEKSPHRTRQPSDLVRAHAEPESRP